MTSLEIVSTASVGLTENIAACCCCQGHQLCAGRFQVFSRHEFTLTQHANGYKLACGCCLQMWHWSEKRRLAQYYTELYAKEKAEEEAYTAELQSKLRALEDELLA